SPALRNLGHQLVDLIADVMESQGRDPVMAPVSGAEMRAAFDDPAPQDGLSPDEVLKVVQELIRSGVRRNGHPRFFAYVMSSADPIGVLADALASALNQNVTAWRSAPLATEMERQVIRWLDEMVGFGGGGHGLLVGGGSAANFTGIACALAGI